MLMEEVATAIQLELIQSSHKVEMEDRFISKFLDPLWFHLLVIDALVPGGEHRYMVGFPLPKWACALRSLT